MIGIGIASEVKDAELIAIHLIARSEFTVPRSAPLDYEIREIESPTGEALKVAEVFGCHQGNVVACFWSTPCA